MHFHTPNILTIKCGNMDQSVILYFKDKNIAFIFNIKAIKTIPNKVT